RCGAAADGATPNAVTLSAVARHARASERIMVRLLLPSGGLGAAYSRDPPASVSSAFASAKRDMTDRGRGSPSGTGPQVKARYGARSYFAPRLSAVVS